MQSPFYTLFSSSLSPFFLVTDLRMFYKIFILNYQLTFTHFLSENSDIQSVTQYSVRLFSNGLQDAKGYSKHWLPISGVNRCNILMCILVFDESFENRGLYFIRAVENVISQTSMHSFLTSISFPNFSVADFSL